MQLWEFDRYSIKEKPSSEVLSERLSKNSKLQQTAASLQLIDLQAEAGQMYRHGPRSYIAVVDLELSNKEIRCIYMWNNSFVEPHPPQKKNKGNCILFLEENCYKNMSCVSSVNFVRTFHIDISSFCWAVAQPLFVQHPLRAGQRHWTLSIPEMSFFCNGIQGSCLIVQNSMKTYQVTLKSISYEQKCIEAATILTFQFYGEIILTVLPFLSKPANVLHR